MFRRSPALIIVLLVLFAAPSFAASGNDVNVIRDNVADDNVWYGVAIDAPALGSGGNTAIRNRGHGNGEFDGSDGSLMPPCGANVWDANDFGSVNQPCVAARVQEAPEAQ